MTLQQVEVKNSGSHLAYAQDMTLELVNTKMKEPAYLNYKRIDKVNPDIAKTLCARDYKGYGTGFDTMNGVIEK